MIGGRTRLFVLLGRPVAHALSPAMQNAAFQALGLDAVYVALDCASEDTFALARALAKGGGGGNVTVPYKEVLAAALEHPSDRVRRLGSANVFRAEGEELKGDSTDLDGVLEALALLEAPATRWLLIGTGGSARAVIGAAAERGASIAVRSRSVARAKEFTSWAAELGVGATEPAECEVVINTTPLGLSVGDPLPLEIGEAPRAVVALDLVYHRGETPWVRHCRAKGLRAADGREMLVGQGAKSLEWWFPKVQAPREVMRAAVARALA